jgi:hypothetical protein
MVNTWTVRALRNGEWATAHEGPRFMDAWAVWDGDANSVLLRNGRVLKNNSTQQLILETA